ncbi:MAG: hypothetical protein QOG87_3618 [Actinomycetota bacterium]
MIELVPLCTMTAELRKPFVLRGTPAGDRLIYEVESGSISGERFDAKMCGQAAADWFTIGPDGTGTLDVRVLVETDDGAHVFIQYLGRVDTTTPDAPIYSTPRFETGDERYLWLNKVQAVGKGILAENGTTLTYEICEVR